MRRTDLIKNETLFKILLSIAGGQNYNEAVANILKIKPSSAIKHLQFLEKKKVITSVREKELNKKVYSLNYERLAVLFGEDLAFCLTDNVKEFPYYSEEQKEEILTHIKPVTEPIKESKSVPYLLQALFIYYTSDFKDLKNTRLSSLSEPKDLRDIFALALAFIKYVEEDEEKRKVWGEEYDRNKLFNAISLLKKHFLGERKNSPYIAVFKEVLKNIEQNKAKGQ